MTVEAGKAEIIFFTHLKNSLMEEKSNDIKVIIYLNDFGLFDFRCPTLAF